MKFLLFYIKIIYLINEIYFNLCLKFNKKNLTQT